MFYSVVVKETNLFSVCGYLYGYGLCTIWPFGNSHSPPALKWFMLAKCKSDGLGLRWVMCASLLDLKATVRWRRIFLFVVGSKGMQEGCLSIFTCKYLTSVGGRCLVDQKKRVTEDLEPPLVPLTVFLRLCWWCDCVPSQVRRHFLLGQAWVYVPCQASV